MFELSELLFGLMASGMGMVVAFGLYLVNALTYYKMAEKANVRNSWLAFIPFLQFILFFHMIDRSAWYMLLYLIPILNIVLHLYFTYQLFEAFDVGGTMGLLVLVLSLFMGIALAVYMLYIAFSDNVQYVADNRYGPY